MPKFVAVMGKSKTNRILSVEAATEGQARIDMIRQLSRNPQRREILGQWQTSGATIIQEPEPEPFDEALANARIRGKLQCLLAELALRATKTGPIPESAPVFYAIDDAREALTAYDRRTNR